MKITRNTADQLILERTPWVLTTAFVFGSIVGFGIGITLVILHPDVGYWPLFAGLIPTVFLPIFVWRKQVLLLRGPGHVILRSRSFFGYRERTHQLAELHEAVVQEQRQKRINPMSRVALVFSPGSASGVVPLTFMYDNFSDHAGMVAAINRWLKATDGP